MSQVFSADSVNGPINTSVVTTAETTGATGNFLSPPFQNAKAVVTASIYFQPGTGTTSVSVRLRRNPSAENLAITNYANLAVTAGNLVVLNVQAIDAPIGPGPVQYAVSVQQTGATGNGTIVACGITTFLISG